MTDTTFFGEGLRFERPQVARTVRRTSPEQNLHTGDIPTLTHLPSMLGSKAPEVQNVSLLPDIVSLGGDFLGTNAEMLGDAAAGTADWASRHRYILGFDIMGLLSFKWGSKLWRMVTRPRDRY